MELKCFQKKAIDLLRRYLEAARVSDPAAAFDELATEGNPGFPVAPYRAPPGLRAMPYVCLRLPTGGGKTFLAASTIAVAAKAYLETEHPVVLWLVPSTTIRSQTVEALKNPAHPYRRRLDEQFGVDAVAVFDLSEHTQIRPQDLATKVCVIVATIQSFRARDKEGRKLYAHSEAFETHFMRVPPNAPGLKMHEAGSGRSGPVFSFVNVLHRCRPLVLVDEAHNARTELSYDALEAVNPAAIIELTATPAGGKGGSNVLYRVSADEVRDAELIKLPIILDERRDDWRAAVNGAVLMRARLAEIAKSDADYIRPIVLYQAQNKGEEVDVEALKKHLVENEKVAEDSIATGDQRELDGVNVMDPANKIEHVITVQALREGWDCPFAYVFCSVAEIHSKTAVEQFLGRVLRMPYAKRRKAAELNRAYAFVNSRQFGVAATTLRDRMVETMGLEPGQADEAIQEQASFGPLFGEQAPAERPVQARYELSEDPNLDDLSPPERAAIKVEPTDKGTFVVTVTGDVSTALGDKIVAAAPPEHRAAIKAAVTHQRTEFLRRQAPAARGEHFVAPRIQLRLDGLLEEPDRDGLLQLGGWKLTDWPAELDEAEFAVRHEGQQYVIDVIGKQVQTRHLQQSAQFDFSGAAVAWDDLALSRWLDRQLAAPDITQADKLEFCRRAVDGLRNKRGLPLDELVRFKYLLLQAMRHKIEKARRQAATKGWQAALFPDNPAFVLTFAAAEAFTFDATRGYAPRSVYRGGYKFSKEFYGKTGDLDATGEEFECAKALDMQAGVKHWFRNISNDAARSFWLLKRPLLSRLHCRTERRPHIGDRIQGRPLCHQRRQQGKAEYRRLLAGAFRRQGAVSDGG